MDEHAAGSWIFNFLTEYREVARQSQPIPNLGSMLPLCQNQNITCLISQEYLALGFSSIEGSDTLKIEETALSSRMQLVENLVSAGYMRIFLWEINRLNNTPPRDAARDQFQLDYAELTDKWALNNASTKLAELGKELESGFRTDLLEKTRILSSDLNLLARSEEQRSPHQIIVIHYEQRSPKIVNIFRPNYGSFMVSQAGTGETKVSIGDSFGDISQSVIATQSSVAQGIIKIRQYGNDELASAIETLGKSISEASDMSEESRLNALQLLEELTKQASLPQRVKSVVKVIGSGLWDAVKHVGSIKKTLILVWPVIEHLWK